VLCVGAAVFVFAYLVRGLVSQLVAKSGCANNTSGWAGVSNCLRKRAGDLGGTNLDTLLEGGHLIANGRGRRPGKKKKSKK
jgi:hypothetical protein